MASVSDNLLCVLILNKVLRPSVVCGSPMTSLLVNVQRVINWVPIVNRKHETINSCDHKLVYGGIIDMGPSVFC